MTTEEKIDVLDEKLQKQTIQICRLVGEWTGMLEGICMWEIPKELKVKLQKKIKELKAIK